MKDIPVCPVCSSIRKNHFTETVLHKYEVNYYYCDCCGLLQTEEPHWLDEAYLNVIADADTGLVSRNISIALRLSVILFFLFDKKNKFLDIAGGYGMMTRLMRDIGFDYYWFDSFCQNIFAKGFEQQAAVESSFEAVTAFEVLEHVPNPIDFIQQSLENGKLSTLIFSTELFSGTPPHPSDWDYYAFPTGQHISFFQLKTLDFIADKLSLQLYSSGNFHILSKHKICSLTTWRILSNSIVSRVLAIFVVFAMRHNSKTFPDHEKALRSKI